MMETIQYYVALLGVAILSLMLGKIFAPIVVWLLGRISIKTRTSLDDRIFAEIRGPLESSFFVFVFYLTVHYVPFFAASIPIVDAYASAAVTLLITFLGVKLVKAFFNWYYDEGRATSHIKIDVTLLPFLQKAVQLIIIVMGSLVVLGEVGFDVTGIITLTSVIALVLGLASQETLANIFAGLALQIDRPYNYGDYLRLPTGEVVRLRKIGMRSTKLYDLMGNVVVISNSEFAKLRVARLGALHAKAELPISFDAPIELPPEEIVEYVKSSLEKEKPEGVESTGNIRVVITRVKVPGWYEGLLLIPVKDYSYSMDITHRVSKLIRERIVNARKAT
ncbi:MAG: mechanosensitive ion channel family protein [Candidatus Micrarchaeia archaeon]